MKKHVQVRDAEGNLLVTYEIILRGMNYEPLESEFLAEAKRMAAEDRLVPEDQLPSLRFVAVG